jgi:hypothetical protein
MMIDQATLGDGAPQKLACGYSVICICRAYLDIHGVLLSNAFR